MVTTPSFNGCNAGGHVQHWNLAASIGTVQNMVIFVASVDVLHSRCARARTCPSRATTCRASSRSSPDVLRSGPGWGSSSPSQYPGQDPSVKPSSRWDVYQWFKHRIDAKILIEKFRRQFNEVRPNSSLVNLSWEGKAAIDTDDCSGYLIGIRTGQKKCGLGNVSRHV
jgi:hypothetical protein